ERIHRQPIRAQGDHLLESASPARRSLQREPTDEVEVDGAETQLARALEPCAGFFYRLDASHRALHLRIEILYAHRQAVEPEPCQQGELRVGRYDRIDFDRDLRIGAQVEARVQRRKQQRELPFIEKRRRAAAPVEL